MKHLNWKDHESGSSARAGREVGGYYRIAWRESYLSWQGATIEARYEVEYRSSTRRDWDEIEYPRGVLGFATLAEAKHMAEEDREQRARELADEQALERLGGEPYPFF